MAKGTIYIDDGETFNYRDKNEKTYMEFEFDGDKLNVNSLLKDSYYSQASQIKISEINIYGISEQPKNIRNIYEQSKTGESTLKYTYNKSERSLLITNIEIPIDDGSRGSESGIELILIEYEAEKKESYFSFFSS